MNSSIAIGSLILPLWDLLTHNSSRPWWHICCHLRWCLHFDVKWNSLFLLSLTFPALSLFISFFFFTSKVPGNTDYYGLVYNFLSRHIQARFVRFYPVDYSTWPCLRVEIYVGYWDTTQQVAWHRKTKWLPYIGRFRVYNSEALFYIKYTLFYKNDVEAEVNQISRAH